MARPKSEFLRSLGTMLEIWKAIVDEVLSLGGNDESLRRILTSKTLRRQIAELIVSTTNEVAFTLSSLIEAGKYDYINPYITASRFPMPEGLTLGAEPKLFHFNNCFVSPESAILEIKKSGYRPATIWDLLDYGAKNPELQRQFPIVALGSVAYLGNACYVAFLGRGEVRRGLELDRFDGHWSDDYRFLAVRN